MVRLQTVHDYPTPDSFHRYQPQNALGFVPLTILPVECTRVGGRAVSREMCRHDSPRFPISPTSAFLFELLQLLLLLLSRSAHGHDVRLKIPRALRTARVLTIILPSRGFSCRCTPSFRRDTALRACTYAFTIGVPTMVVQAPSLQHERWVAINAPLCLALDAGVHLNQLIESKALF